jgi:hypothetical protein
VQQFNLVWRVTAVHAALQDTCHRLGVRDGGRRVELGGEFVAAHPDDKGVTLIESHFHLASSSLIVTQLRFKVIV